MNKMNRIDIFSSEFDFDKFIKEIEYIDMEDLMHDVNQAVYDAVEEYHRGTMVHTNYNKEVVDKVYNKLVEIGFDVTIETDDEDNNKLYIRW